MVLVHGLLNLKSLVFYFTKLSLKEAENVKISYWNLSYRTLVQNTKIRIFQLSEAQVSNNHNANALATKILIKILYNH